MVLLCKDVQCLRPLLWAWQRPQLRQYIVKPELRYPIFSPALSVFLPSLKKFISVALQFFLAVHLLSATGVGPDTFFESRIIRQWQALGDDTSAAELPWPCSPPAGPGPMPQTYHCTLRPFTMLAGSEIFSLEMSKTEALTQVLTQRRVRQGNEAIAELFYTTLQAGADTT